MENFIGLILATLLTMDMKQWLSPSNENGEVTSWLEVYANRYFTWAEAEAGHKLATDPNFLKENLWE